MAAKNFLTNNNARWSFYIILFSVTLVLSAIFITINIMSSSSPFTKKEPGFSIKKVYTAIPSSDGESHTIAADFYITSTKKNITQAELKELQSAILEIIPTLDYNKITDKGGTNYLTNSIKKDLNSRSSEEWIEEVYVSNLLLDVGISPAKGEHGNVIEEMFKDY
ncbi:MAG: hypothetical protein GX209_07330 [Epulopiscium sp.]|nr:hypothetical protein [Candidatus Epulonipiscium sp.]